MTLNGDWKFNLLNQYLRRYVANEIRCHPPPHAELGSDTPRWALTPDGTFTTKTANSLATDEYSALKDHSWDFVWKWDGPQRVRVLLWQLLRGGLKINGRRARYGMATNDRCPLCRCACNGDRGSSIKGLLGGA
ncbi:Reverse transcriptase zinc-binding domain [Sesbania bispinosa]|nr:Reverse transcriptase zinc-binding domain [Sesbania bispinosa]